MIDILDRTRLETLADTKAPDVVRWHRPYKSARSPTTPPVGRPPVHADVTTPWPLSARIVTGILLVLVIAAAFGLMIRSSDDATTPTAPDAAEYQSQIADLTDRLDAQTSRATTAEVARNALEGELLAAQAQAAALEGRTTELQLTIDGLVEERDDTAIENAVLDGTTITQAAAIDELTTERDALAALFPLTTDGSLVGVDVTGTYDISWTEAYCDGLARCGTTPTVTVATITDDDNGWLTLSISGVVIAGLDRTDGALYTVADTTIVNGGTNQTARVAITVYAHRITTTDDGTQTIDDLGASIAISTSAGVVVYGAVLTPRS